ncbi:MAG TPA: ATP-binding protein [Nocardioidaceae bacterium]|nr:ATP-binding protein [Nocardioidaceae bacterium]
MQALRSRVSLAGRVTLLATIAVGLSVAIVALAGYLTMRHQLYASIDDSLHDRATYAAKSGSLKDIQSSAPPWLPGATDVHIRQVFADGEVHSSDSEAWTREAPLFGDAELAVARGDDYWTSRTIRTSYGAFRVCAVPVPETESALVLAQSLAPVEKTLDKLGLVLFLFGALGVVAAGLAGWAVASNGLRPVRRLTAAVEEIARTEKLEPIAVEGNDDIARLSHAFNQMLTAVAASRDRQRQLVADAGHELRTPLTSLRTNLDLLTQAEKRGGLSAGARTELFDDVRFQIEELTTLIGDLTELARDEPISAEVEAVDFDEVVERAVDRVRRRGSDLHFDVDVDQWWVVGEAGSLERAITNLLDNAAKWSPVGGTVSVVLREGTLTVRDQGPGIAPVDLPQVFDRFYRSKESRTMPGSGLGLAIVRQIMERHGGSVWVAETGPSGTVMTCVVPGSAQHPEALSRSIGHA